MPRLKNFLVTTKRGLRVTGKYAKQQNFISIERSYSSSIISNITIGLWMDVERIQQQFSKRLTILMIIKARCYGLLILKNYPK